MEGEIVVLVDTGPLLPLNAGASSPIEPGVVHHAKSGDNGANMLAA